MPDLREFTMDMFEWGGVLRGRRGQIRRLARPQPTEAEVNAGCVACPYGQVGDRLWVSHPVAETEDGLVSVTDATILPTEVRPGGFVTTLRQASRLESAHEIEVEHLRLTRLQDYQEDDLVLEDPPQLLQADKGELMSARWDREHAIGSKWSDNPWVWVVRFRLKKVTKC